MDDGKTIQSPDRRKLLKKIGLTGAGGIAGLAIVNGIAPLVVAEDTVFDTNHSYWSLALPSPSAPLQKDIDVEVAIVGGGFTGLSTAYYMSKTLAGKRIAIIEAKGCGNGASGRNGAMVLNLKNSSVSAEVSRRLYQLTVANVQSIRALSAATGIDCELEQNGALTVASTADELREAQADMSQLRGMGLPLEFLNKDRVQETLGVNAYVGGILDPNAGQVHPGKLVHLWKAAALAAGVQIYENTPVQSIEEGAVHELTTVEGRKIRSTSLVIATNAYTSKLGLLRSAVAPITNYVGITPVLGSERLAALNWKGPIPFNDSRREVYYAGLTRDRRIHFGGGAVDYAFNNGMGDPPLAAQRYVALHREFARIFPSLADVTFERTWSGFVDVSLDQNPTVGQMGRHNNIFYGIGYSGEGVNLTSVFGRVIADLAAGRQEQWAWLPYLNRRPPYIPNEPFRWLAIKGDLAYTRLTGG
jgi:gamma-glutamylputrescine oxidase